MQLDKKMIDLVLKLNDEQLWKAIQMVASKSGLDIKSIQMPTDMSKIRSTLSGLSDDDIKRANELLKKGKKNG